MISQEKIHYDFVFVVLTYCSFEDLEDFIASAKQCFNKMKIIVVNSFYDELSRNKIEVIAKNNDCDFLNVENKGYGYGNNRGIEHANSLYKYEFLIVSNPDVIIKKNDMDYSQLFNRAVVIAPEIVTKTGKKQNPYWAKKNVVAERLIYQGYKLRNKLIVYFGIGIYKISREVFLVGKKNNKKVYAAHGSFTIFSKQSLDLLGLPFDERMFLFAEESMLAHILENKSIPIFYTTDVSILHKEDGSMKIEKIDESSITRDSVLYYYDKYVKRKA